ncbi:MAG: GNAT family N-acetyltransferase [Proteobacteria bacterium]|nr:GNAT family N-acetyltransferase [Pseudomonadota bacterium]
MNDQPDLSKRPDLHTERLLLRRPDRRDVECIVEAVGDWEVARRLGRVPHPYGPDDAKFFLEEIVPKEWTWAIVMKGSARLIGCVGLTPDAETGTAELGYWLSQAFWGRGFVTEAASAVVDFGFVELKLPFILSGHWVGNEPSGRVLQKLGFEEIGRSHRSCLALGYSVPSVEMRLSCKHRLPH